MYFTNRIHKNSFTYIYFRIYDIAWRSNQWTIVINWERYHITSYIHSVFIHMPYIYSSIMRCDFYWYLQKDKNTNIKNFFKSNNSMNQRIIEDMFELCIILVDIAALFSVNRIKWYLDILPGKWWAKQISCNISQTYKIVRNVIA